VQRLLIDREAPVEEQATSPGGSAANTIYGLAKLGVSTGFIGAVGDDAEGQMLLEDFQGADVDVSRIKIKQGITTGSVLCLTDRRGRRSLYVSPGANSQLAEQDIDMEYLSQAKIIHLSSFVDEEQHEAQNRVLEAIPPSTTVSLAPGEIYASKGLSTLATMINRARILFINQRELKELTGKGIEKGAQRCLEQGCHIVAVTLGGKRDKGKLIACYLNDGEQEYLIKVQRDMEQPVVDTTGAGDAFAAGFLYGLLKGESPRKCALVGQIMAQFVISHMGARRGLPTLPQLAQKHEELFGQPL
jgi:ribokinase